MNFFRRILNLFRRKEEPVIQAPVAPVKVVDPNYEAWLAYQATIKETGKFPTESAAPKSTIIPAEYVGSTRTYDEYLKDKYGAVPNWGKDLTSEQVAATATKRDLSLLPDPPSFKFTGNTPEEVRFNEIRATQGQQAAYKHLMGWQWNELGTQFREQALASGIAKEDISRIINTYSSGGGGVYFKP